MTKGKILIDGLFINLMEQIDRGELQLKDAAKLLNVSPSALCQKRTKWKLQQPPASLSELSEQRQIFCQAKGAGASNKEAARLAYPEAKESSLPVIASQVLSEPLAQVAIADLMARHGIDRNFRTSRLKDVICSPDLNIAVKGLDQSWKLDGSYAPDKLEVSVTDIQLRALLDSVILPPIDITPEVV